MYANTFILLYLHIEPKSLWIKKQKVEFYLQSVNILELMTYRQHVLEVTAAKDKFIQYFLNESLIV